MAKVTVKAKPQAMYSHAGSKELLQKVLNDPKYTIQRWNPSKGEYDTVCPYEVFRTVLKKAIAELKYPNKAELEDISTLNIRVSDELVDLLPELVSAHLDNDMKFSLLKQPTSNAVIYKKFVPAGSKVSAVRNIQENRVDGTVKSEWGDYWAIKCKSTRPKDVTTKTRMR